MTGNAEKAPGRASRALPLALGLGLAGCGDPGPGPGSGSEGSSTTAAGSSSDESSSGSTSSTSTAAVEESSGVGSSTDATGGGPAIPDFNGCTMEDYEDRTADAADRTIAIAGMGLTFTPKCMIVAAGQTVHWEGSLSAHPLAPGNPDDGAAGSSDSPIIATSSGTSVDFVFPDAGTFPYYCQLHSFGAGQGMAGVVHVLTPE